MTSRKVLLALLLPLALPACHSSASEPGPKADHAASVHAVSASGVGTDPGHVGAGTPLVPRKGDHLAAFAGGCFWGMEDVFRHVPGVVATAVGYTGGHTTYPTYPKVSSHTTGHAETVLVEFNPKRITYPELLRVFFKNHDPTTLDRQGPDVGSNYRSAIFTFDQQQAAQARAAKQQAQAELGKTVVTEIDPIGRFWKAEEYHQQWDEKHGTHSCPLPKGLPHSGT